MAVPGDANEYYPAASLRLGESGVVVLHFAVAPDQPVS
jgi:outer membrane biosynthesis protein TonB